MINKILVPLDGSKLAEKALPHAEELAHRFEAELILIRVAEPGPRVTSDGLSSNKLENEQLLDEASLYLNSVKGELREHHLPAQTIVAQNRGVAETIIQKAYEKACDLIVMSTHGRSGVGQWIFGSVANKILQDAPCPVYLVRAKAVEKT